jgi:uncharacterized membrane protein
MKGGEETLPRHIEQTVEAVEQFHADHLETANWADRLLGRLRAAVSRPAFIAVLSVCAGLWLAIGWLRLFSFDRPPFPYLQLFLSLGAVYLTTLILATQRRADRLASHREKLILQLAFVSEQKNAKIIALLEELRRDSPQVKDRSDPVAEEMTEAVNARVVSDALRDVGLGDGGEGP